MKTVLINFLVSPNVKKEIEEKARRYGISLSEYVRARALEIPIQLDLNPESDEDKKILNNMIDDYITKYELRISEYYPLVDINDKISDFINKDFMGLFYGLWNSDGIEFDNETKIYRRVV